MSRPQLSPAQVLRPEDIDYVQKNPVFTPELLHQLKQQIEQLRRFNIQKRAGWRGVASVGASAGASARSTRPISIAKATPRRGGGAGRGGGRGGGRQPAAAKRRREEEEEGGDDEEDDSIINNDTEEEEEAETSEEEEEEFDTASTSSEEEEVEVSSGSGGGGEEEEEGAGLARARAAKQRPRGGPAAAAGADSEEEKAGPTTQRRASGRGGGGQKRGGRGGGGRGQVVLVRDTGGKRAVKLPQLTAVAVSWGPQEEAGCSVCGDGETAEGNAILLCEGQGCSVAVHQLCYGLPAVPDGEWLCDACAAGLGPKQPNCSCCPVVGGALRKVESLGKVVPAGGPGAAAYVHLACALWTPEITISRAEHMDGIVLDRLPPSRVGLRCELCRQGGGAVVQCSHGTCCRAFHVLCGRAAGQVLSFRYTDGEPLAFCAAHSAPGFERAREVLMEGRVALAAEKLAAVPAEQPGSDDADSD